MGVNAQTSVPKFTAGQILTAQQQTEINTGIPVFADSTARDAAFGGTGEKTLAEGQFAFLEDTNATQYYDGSTWQAVGVDPASVAYTPTFTNLTVGNGTLDFIYIQVGKLVFVQGGILFGSTTSISGNVDITLPVTAASVLNFPTIGVGQFHDASTSNRYFGGIILNSTTAAGPRLLVVSSTYLINAGTSATIPFTWTTGDHILMTFTYEAA
jgi:hypothetical protein